MASVGLPSVLVWRGMQSRAHCLPALMLDAVRDESPLATHRVSVCLSQLAALAVYVRAARLSLYCRECNKLLVLFGQQDSRRTTLAPILLSAAVRVAHSLGSPLRCLIDSGNLDELRQARGVRTIDQITNPHSAAWAVPRLKAILRKQLVRAHYTLAGASSCSELDTVPALPNSFVRLNRVAALCLGEVLIQSVNEAASYQPICMQILRLELCCDEQSGRRPPQTFSAMQSLFLELSMQQLLRGLRREIRALIQQEERQGGISPESSLLMFHRVNACCDFMSARQGQLIAKISVSAQQLALHLCCWAQQEREASALLCLCVLALERHLDIAIAVLQERRPFEHTDMRLARKVQHFIRTHRRRLRAAYALPGSRSRELAYVELQGIHYGFRKSLKNYKKAQVIRAVEDDFFHALIRFKGIALYMGEMALYELLWNLREVLVLAIERKLLLTKNLIAVLPRLSAYGLRSIKQKRRELGYDTRILSILSEELRTQRQITLSKIHLRDHRISLPASQGRGRKKDQRSITTTQLPSFLAKNIRALIADPVAIYRCQSAQEFGGLSRVVILELTLLTRGARALQVERVAALSEVLLEVYRALNGLSELPERGTLKLNLQGAHGCLRLALNQAAARQKVCDVRPTIVALYHFLECLHRVPSHSPDSIQAAQSAVNSLAADMRAFADVFASALNQDREWRYSLAQEQLQRLLAATRRLQEDLAANGMTDIARWGPSLVSVVGRYSNERGKPARLKLYLDDFAAERAVVQRLQSPLQSLLCLMIEHSVEGAAQRRAVGKPDTASLTMRATHTGAELSVSVEDDGAGLTLSQIARVAEEIAIIGGSLNLSSEATGGSQVSVNIACVSVRWDIASKSL
jgi:hypothetical protein